MGLLSPTLLLRDVYEWTDESVLGYPFPPQPTPILDAASVFVSCYIDGVYLLILRSSFWASLKNGLVVVGVFNLCTARNGDP
jgi:hypothetical protein